VDGVWHHQHLSDFPIFSIFLGASIILFPIYAYTPFAWGRLVVSGASSVIPRTRSGFSPVMELAVSQILLTKLPSSRFRTFHCFRDSILILSEKIGDFDSTHGVGRLIYRLLSTLHTFPLRVIAHVRIDQITLPLNHIYALPNSLSESILYWPVITFPNRTKSSSPRVKHLSQLARAFWL